MRRLQEPTLALTTPELPDWDPGLVRKFLESFKGTAKRYPGPVEFSSLFEDIYFEYYHEKEWEEVEGYDDDDFADLFNFYSGIAFFSRDNPPEILSREEALSLGDEIYNEVMSELVGDRLGECPLYGELVQFVFEACKEFKFTYVDEHGCLSLSPQVPLFEPDELSPFDAFHFMDWAESS